MDGATQSSSDVTDFSEVNSTPLDLDDLFDVQKELISVSAKWRSIGIALRLKPNILDGIETRHNGDPPACLTLTVTEWLNRNYNVKRFGEPTWQALVKAVGDPAGGANMALARDMATRHKAGGPPPSFSPPPPPSLEPAIVTYSPPHLLPQPHLDVLGSQEAAAIGEKNARDSGEPCQKYRRVMPPDSPEEVQKYRITSLRAEIEDLKEQLQAKEDKLLQKDAELSALQVQLRDFKSNFQTFQTQLGLPLKLSWKRSSDLPFAMCSSTIRPVTLKGKVYMVGCRIGVPEGTVVVYDTYNREWNLLPKRHDQVKMFGMGVVNYQLTLVGGFDQLNHKVTNKLAVWESESEQWTFPYPPMLTARYDVAVATYNEWMAVAGGEGDNGYLDSVEILNSTEKQWYSAAPLPMGCTPLKSAVVRDEWYLMVCYDSTVKIVGFAVSLPALILLRGNASSTPWRNIPIPPLIDTAALATRDSLFAVGGRTSSTKIISSAIHLYLPWKKKWIEAGRLQTERASCTCIELPSGEILVAGGSEPKCDGPSRWFTHTNRVDIATFMDL